MPCPGVPPSGSSARRHASYCSCPRYAFVVGEHGAPIENRAPVAFSGLDNGWYSLSQLSTFLNDRLPLRSRAILADAWVDQNVFNEDPAFGGGSNPRVIRGKDHVLFLADAITAACTPNAPPEDSVANLDRLATIISASGRRVVTMVAPDKSSVHPELLPEGMDGRACFDDYSSALWHDLRAADVPGFVDLQTALIDESTATRELLYLRNDSHWDSAGSIVAVRQMVDSLAPGMWRDDEVNYQGLGDYTGDLTGLLGNPQIDQAPIYTVVRPDVTSVSVEQIDDIEGGFNQRFINDAPPGRLIPGRTVMFLDSFGLVSMSQYVPFFEDLTVMRLVDFDADRFTNLIASADNVWIMSVERSLGFRLLEEIGSPAFLDELDTALNP